MSDAGGPSDRNREVRSRGFRNLAMTSWTKSEPDVWREAVAGLGNDFRYERERARALKAHSFDVELLGS